MGQELSPTGQPPLLRKKIDIFLLLLFSVSDERPPNKFVRETLLRGHKSSVFNNAEDYDSLHNWTKMAWSVYR